MKVSRVLKNCLMWLFEERGNRRHFTALAGSLISIYISIFSYWEQYSEVNSGLLQKDNKVHLFEYSNLFVDYSTPALNQLIHSTDSNYFEHPMEPEMSISGIDQSLEQYISEERANERKVMKYNSDATNTFKEYGDICDFIVEIWFKHPNEEVQGYITTDGKLIITAVGNSRYVKGPKPILYNEQYYLAWDRRHRLKTIHKGIIDRSWSEFIYIPVKAMFHTHVISGNLSQEDLIIASELNKIKHLMFEPRKISEFDGQGIKKIYRGNFMNLCELLYN